jgi:succinyl-diaminopimelate desuccinylase
MLSALELTRDLVRFRTINPPGDELPCAQHLGNILEGAGFSILYHPMGDNRANLIARLGGNSARLPICFSGHTDVVPLGAQQWSVDPFAAEISDGKIYGRGTTDMKAGVAAFVTAACKLAPRLRDTPGLLFVITAGEERGCEGANFLARNGLLPQAGALLIAEPTSNRVFAGHKGVLWLEGETGGVTAHGSMPEQGVNAIYKAARVALALGNFDFSGDEHPVLGRPTLNVGWMQGGINVNSVPDSARLGIDLRIVPGVDRQRLLARLAEATGGEASFTIKDSHDPVWTDPSDAWVSEVIAVRNAIVGQEEPPSGATYFTDAAALKPAMGQPPVVILGPGEPGLAHQTDEYCRIDKIEEAQAIYEELIVRWCGV